MKKTETIAARIKDLKDRKAIMAKDIECCELSWLGRVCLEEQIMKIDNQIERLAEQIKSRADMKPLRLDGGIMTSNSAINY